MSERDRQIERENVSVDMNVNQSLKMATATVSTGLNVSGMYPQQDRILGLPYGVIKSH